MFMAKRQPSSRYLLAAEIPRRYDVGLLSSQCLTLGSSWAISTKILHLRWTFQTYL